MKIAWAVVLVGCVGLAACGRKAHDAGDGGASADAAGADPDGVNATDVERFADETKIDHEAATLTQLATVRISPPRGEPIVNLEAGASVQKLASHATFFLVSFTNPKTGSRTMGWVPQDAIGGNAAPLNVVHHAHGDGGLFATPLDAGAHHDASVAVADAGKHGEPSVPSVHKQCAANFALARLPDGDDCLQKCKTQADCPNKTFCTSGTLADPPGQTAKLCFKVSN